MNLFFSLLGCAFQIFAYTVYMRSVLKWNTKPHLYTWLLWWTLATIVTIIQITHNAGWSVLISGLMAFCNLSIAAISLKYGDTFLTSRDKYLLAFAIVTIILWQVTSNDLMAIILVCLIDGIAFYFTFKKSYHKPDEEKLSAYILWTAELACFFLAVQNPNLTTLLYPIFLTIMEGTFVFFLLWRRKIIKK